MPGATAINDIFISYRRDDSAGHAGRLFDGLKERLGAKHVFMDVSGLRPGQDFAAELAHAVARADCLLAVIGPRWLSATDVAGAPGRRRIDDPDDFVRREIGAALAKGASIIPVLVHGAAMPRADQLPDALRPLAGRHAIELSDRRWDSDLRELVQVLLADGPRAPPASRVAEPAAVKPAVAKPAPPRRLKVGAIALVALALALALAAGGAWMAFNLSHRNAPIAASGPDQAAPHAVVGTPAAEPPTPPTPPTPAGSAQRFAVALPPVSEVRFRTHRAQVVLTILAIRQEPRDSASQVLTLRVRMLNRGPSDEAFGSDQFRLVAGDQTIAPTDTLISAVDTTAAKEANLRFVAPSGVADVALDVRVNAESTRMPISLAARTPIRNDPSLDDFGQPKPARVVDALKDFPASLAVGQLVEVGKVGYRISAAVIERETVEKASLTLTVRCSAPRGSGGVSFGSSAVRLWVDGVPRAPLNFVNLAVDGGDSKEDRFVFDLVSMPQTLEAGILNAGDSVRVPLPVASLTRR